jgi:hypothetical protein
MNILNYLIYYYYYDIVGIPLLLIGLQDGSIIARSRLSMNLLFRIPGDWLRTGPPSHTNPTHNTTSSIVPNAPSIWGLKDLGQHGSFVAVNQEGKMILWSILLTLQDRT